MRATGGVSNPYADDVDYDNFLGAPVERIYYHWGMRCFVRNVVREPKKPSDHAPLVAPVPLVRVDEGTPRKPHGKVRSPALRNSIREALLDGPKTALAISELTGYTTEQVRQYINNHGYLYQPVGEDGRRVVYGLADQDYSEVGVVGTNKHKVTAYLTEHGPSGVTALVEGVGLSPAGLRKLIASNPHLLHEVRKEKHYSKMTSIWGVVGLHEVEA